MNQIELASVCQGNTVIVINMNQTHDENQIFSEIRQDYAQYTNQICAVKDGMGLGILQAVKTSSGEESYVELVNAAVQALSAGNQMGTRQMGTLRTAIINAIELRERFSDEGKALAYGLSQIDNELGEIVYEKIWTLLNCGALKSASKTMQKKKINIIDMKGTDLLTQASLAELTLSSLWRRIRLREPNRESKILITIDEFQNLSLKKDSPLMRMLTEGRKFGVSLLLATQSFEMIPKAVRPALNQMATHLYFRPSVSEAKNVAKNIVQQIGSDNVGEWTKTVLNLKKGESIAVGEFVCSGKEIKRPILLK
jgi:hypothetical protein